MVPFVELAAFAKLSTIASGVGLGLAVLETAYIAVKLVVATVKASTMAIAGRLSIICVIILTMPLLKVNVGLVVEFCYFKQTKYEL